MGHTVRTMIVKNTASRAFLGPKLAAMFIWSWKCSSRDLRIVIGRSLIGQEVRVQPSLSMRVKWW